MLFKKSKPNISFYFRFYTFKLDFPTGEAFSFYKLLKYSYRFKKKAIVNKILDKIYITTSRKFSAQMSVWDINGIGNSEKHAIAFDALNMHDVQTLNYSYGGFK